MQFRNATFEDAPLLARMNKHLIEDEGHHNAMTVEQLEERMRDFLVRDYAAVLFCSEEGEPLGYALYRDDLEWTYLRQFYVAHNHRHQAVGKTAMTWLKANEWPAHKPIRLDVLVGNGPGVSFWRSLGFKDYCLTMELTP